LDSHGTVGIERTTFWRKPDGAAVEPFTEITAADVVAKRFMPRDAALTADVLGYLRELERSNRYRLMVWPVHCVLGTWGHNVHASVAAAVAQWEERVQHNAVKVLKGMNPMTEQYSAVQAEVPVATDPLTLRNAQLIEHCRPDAGYLLVAGEAASHCVAATMDDVFEAFGPDELTRTIILKDCMSPVRGFESQAAHFFERARALGASVMTAADALQATKR
jgi:nicotinamidase-related amidase